AAWREGRREDVADVHLVAESVRHRRGRVVHLDPGYLPAQLARDTERRARATSHVEIAAASAPGWTAPPEPSQERARSFVRTETRLSGNARYPSPLASAYRAARIRAGEPLNGTRGDGSWWRG